MGLFFFRALHTGAWVVMSTGTWLPRIRCRTVMRHRHVINIVSEPQPPQPPHTVQLSSSQLSVSLFFWCTSGQSDDGWTRRQFRAFRRHERLTVRMDLAEALHHSAQPTGPVDTHAAPRGQKEPPLGTRPGVLKDSEPQLLDAVLAYRAAGEPSVATPLLAA